MAKKTTEREYSNISKEKNGDWHHLVEHCLDLFDRFKGSEYREAKIAEIKKSRKVYEQERETVNDPWPGASNIELPLCTISVDNLEPRHVAGLVGRKPYIKFVQEGQGQPEQEVEIVENWWNFELEYSIKIEDHTRGIVHDLLLEGTVFPLPSYDIEEITRRDFVFDQGGMAVVGENGTYQTEDFIDPVFEGGRVELVPFTDVFIPDDVNDWNKAPVIRKIYPTYAELKRDSESKVGYYNIGEWLIKEEGEFKLTDDQKSPAQGLSGVEVTGKETIECIECSLSYVYQEKDQEKEDIEDWTEERIVVQIALDKQICVRIIKLRDLNFKNEHLLKRVRLFSEKGRSYGTSVYGKMKSIQDGASKTFNTVMNVADVTMLPWFFFQESVGLKGDITIKPGEGIQVESVEGLLFPKFNIDPSQFIEFIYVWTTMWERLLSIGDLQVGRPQEDKKTTATEVMAVIQEGNVKHNYQSSQFKDEFLDIIRTLYDLYYQNMPMDKKFTYNDQEVVISRKVMQRVKNFRLTGSTELMNKLIQRKESEDLYTLSIADTAALFNPVLIREDLLRSYGKDNPEEYINPFMAQLSQLLQEFPQIQQVVEQAVQETIQTAQALQQGAPG